jgi:uncharacterized protein YggT (Ycf19 family)
MYVFYALVFLCLLLLWLTLSRYFVKIGQAVDKIIKPFKEEQNDEHNEGGPKNE